MVSSSEDSSPDDEGDCRVQTVEGSSVAAPMNNDHEEILVDTPSDESLERPTFGNDPADHCPVLLRTGKGLSIREILEICVEHKFLATKVCTRVPQAIKQNAVFVVDLEKVDHRDLTVDDNGIYGAHSCPTEIVQLELDQSGKISYYMVQSRKDRTADDSSNVGLTSINDVFLVKRHYSWHAKTRCFSRTVIKIEHQQDFLQYAIVQYKVTGDVSDISLFPHGNSKKRKEPFLRTKPTVLEKMKTLGTSNTPKQAIRSLQCAARGSEELLSPSDVPRDRQQMYNVLKKVPGKVKHRNTGHPKVPEFEKLLSQMQMGEFVKYVSFTVKSSRGETRTQPNTFAMTDTQLNWLRTFCTGKKPKSQVGIDMTYNVGPYYVTALTFAHPMFVYRNKPQKHPTVFLGMATSSSRTTEDYEYLASNLRKRGVKTLTYGTDGERALEQGFENVYPINENHANIHLRCFEHVKCDMMLKLREMKVDKNKQNEIVGEILGREYQGKRQKGVVDCEDEKEMEERLVNLKAGYPKDFCDWLETKTGRVRPLQETIKKCMLKPVRTAAGLGDPPNKYDNQRSEAFNNVLKEEMGRKAVDQVHLHEIVEERIVKDQFEELTKAIYGMGEYRLTEDYMHHAIEPIQWTRMFPEQRREYIKKTLGIDEASRDNIQDEKETRSLSIQPDHLQLNVPTYKLQEIWKRAEIIQGNYQVLELENNNVCVTEFDKSFTVNCKPALYECTCQVQRKSGGLCQHVLVVAEKRGKLKELTDRLQQDCQSGSKTMTKNLSRGVGEKPGKARRGRNNVETCAIINVVDNLHNDINSSKPPLYTEFYHNDKPFEIGFIKDHKRALKCESCSCDFPRRLPLAPYDLCLVHQERYKYPEKDVAGVIQMKLTHNKMAKRFYCLRKQCILQRHPYFWIGLMQPQPGVRIRLTDSHKKLLEALFGYILPNN